MKFDWVDFGYSWQEKWSDKPLSKDFHNSTVSLLAKYLRGRDYIKRKAFLWMRSDNVFEISQTPDVLHIEAMFPFETYSNLDEASRLALFADWAICLIFKSKAEFLRQDEIDTLSQRIIEAKFEYIREERVSVIGNTKSKCTAIFTHSPFAVSAKIAVRPENLLLNLPENLFRRDEMDYGKSIRSCLIENDTVTLNTSKGVFTLSK